MLSAKMIFLISTLPVSLAMLLVLETSSANPPQDVEQIEHRRAPNPDMDALYIVSPMTHIVDCLMADFERKRYRKSLLVWTSC